MKRERVGNLSAYISAKKSVPSPAPAGPYCSDAPPRLGRTMAASPLDPIVRRLRRMAGAHRLGELSDAELLGRFVADRDEAAVTALVRRHGPMVLGVCRRLLRHPQDAEDVCQATLLVLLQKATSIRRPTSLASWLH